MTDRDAPPRANWREFFDQVTKDHESDAVTVEVIGVDYGDQLETEPLPFAYIEYDVKDDAVAVGIGGKDGTSTIVTLRPRDALPPPG
jgi:hypothetical protein